MSHLDVTHTQHHPALSDEDVAALFAAGARGDEAEMRRIVEGRGLTWHGAEVETPRPQPRDGSETLP